MIPSLGVFRHRDYALLWLGQLVSNLGDSFQILALAWLVKEMSGSSLLIGTVLAAYMLSVVVLGPIAGVVADRFDKRKLMMLADLLRMAIVGTLAILYAIDFFHVWVVIFLALFMGAATAVFDPARQGSLRFLVNESELSEANSFAMLTRQLSQLIGPALAGIAIAHWGVGLAFWINATSFAVSALFLFVMRFKSKRSESQRSVRGVWEDIKAGLRTVTHHKLLRLILPFGVAVNFLLGPIPVLMPMYSSHLSRLGAAALGYLQSVTAIGMLLGSLLVGFSVKRWGSGHTAVAGLVGAGVGVTALGIVNALTPAGASLGIFGISMVLVNVPLVTVIQRETPMEQQGRVFSVFMSTTTAAQPLAMALGGGLGDAIGIHNVYLAIGVMFILLSLGVASIPSLREVK